MTKKASANEWVQGGEHDPDVANIPRSWNLGRQS